MLFWGEYCSDDYSGVVGGLDGNYIISERKRAVGRRGLSSCLSTFVEGIELGWEGILVVCEWDPAF